MIRIAVLFSLLSISVACGGSKSSQRADSKPAPAAEESGEISISETTISKRRNQNGRRSVTTTGQNNTRNSNRSESDDCIDASADICAIEAQILEITNQYRQQQGLSPLRNNPRIAFVSRDWSERQAQRGSIGHQGFPNQRAQVYLQKFNQSAPMSAENVAYSYFSNGQNQVAQGFMDMWINSPGHRRNITGGYGSLGVGVFRSPNGSYYATQIFSR